MIVSGALGKTGNHFEGILEVGRVRAGEIPFASKVRLGGQIFFFFYFLYNHVYF